MTLVRLGLLLFVAWFVLVLGAECEDRPHTVPASAHVVVRP